MKSTLQIQAFDLTWHCLKDHHFFRDWFGADHCIWLVLVHQYKNNSREEQWKVFLSGNRAAWALAGSYFSLSMLSLAAARSQKPLKEPPEHPGMDEQCPETGARPLAPSLSSSTLKEPVGHNCSLKLEAHTSQTNAERHSLAFNIDQSSHIHKDMHQMVRNQWTHLLWLPTKSFSLVCVFFSSVFSPRVEKLNPNFWRRLLTNNNEGWGEGVDEALSEEERRD